jgi:hypothetical protein
MRRRRGGGVVSAVVLARLRELFLAPAGEEAPARQVAERAVPATLAVLAAREDAAVSGAAVGLAAAGALRAACAVVCVWDGEADAAAPRSDLAIGAARRLGGRLAARGLLVGVRGRLVTVALPAEGSEARAAAERAMAATGDVPVVLVVAGARPAALDPLLAAVDRIVVVPAADAPAGLEDLALCGAARLGRSTAVLRLPPAGSAAGRLLAAAGLALVPSLRAAAAATIGGDRA